MTQAEDKERGVLTVDINYIQVAQTILCLRQKVELVDNVVPMGKAGQDIIHLMTKLKFMLDKAAIEKGEQIERRSVDRRNGDRRERN